MAKTRHLCLRCAPGASRTAKADAAKKKADKKTRTRKTRTTRRDT